MEIKKQTITLSDRNTFNQPTTSKQEIEIISCTIEEFNQMLKDKVERIVNIKRTTNTEFLFKSWDEESKWATFNFTHGLDSIGYAINMDRNMDCWDRLEIVD